MKLEYIENTGDNLYDKILRLYHFDKSQTLAFIEVIKHELIEKQRGVSLNKLDFIDAINCELNLSLSSNNHGIVPLDNNRFDCKMNLENYSSLITMLEDSMKNTGYYWLDNDCDSDICFLYSESGGW